MELKSLGIEGAWLANSQIHSDDRGSFMEWFRFDVIKEFTGLNFSVVQSNISKSNKGVLRGIHYSLATCGQRKWVTCVSGQVIDLVIDLRPSSPSFKKYELIELNGGDSQAVLVGSGLGHGFLSLADNSVVSYLLDSPYSPKEELEVNPFDPEIDIKWPIELIRDSEMKLSIKDANAPYLMDRFMNNQLPSY